MHLSTPHAWLITSRLGLRTESSSGPAQIHSPTLPGSTQKTQCADHLDYTVRLAVSYPETLLLLRFAQLVPRPSLFPKATCAKRTLKQFSEGIPGHLQHAREDHSTGITLPDLRGMTRNGKPYDVTVAMPSTLDSCSCLQVLHLTASHSHLHLCSRSCSTRKALVM